MPVSKGRTAGRAVSRVSTFLPRIQVSSPLPFTVLIQFFRLVHKSELDTDALGIQLIRYIYIYIYIYIYHRTGRKARLCPGSPRPSHCFLKKTAIKFRTRYSKGTFQSKQKMSTRVYIVNFDHSPSHLCRDIYNA